IFQDLPLFRWKETEGRLSCQKRQEQNYRRQKKDFQTDVKQLISKLHLERFQNAGRKSHIQHQIRQKFFSLLRDNSDFFQKKSQQHQKKQHSLRIVHSRKAHIFTPLFLVFFPVPYWARRYTSITIST